MSAPQPAFAHLLLASNSSACSCPTPYLTRTLCTRLHARHLASKPLTLERQMANSRAGLVLRQEQHRFFSGALSGAQVCRSWLVY